MNKAVIKTTLNSSLTELWITSPSLVATQLVRPRVVFSMSASVLGPLTTKYTLVVNGRVTTVCRNYVYATNLRTLVTIYKSFCILLYIWKQKKTLQCLCPYDFECNNISLHFLVNSVKFTNIRYQIFDIWLVAEVKLLWTETKNI